MKSEGGSALAVIDISLPVGPMTVVPPGVERPELRPVLLLSRGDVGTSHRVEMSCHSGMHLDAPAHFIADGATVDQIPVDFLCGACAVVDLSAVRAPLIDTSDLEPKEGLVRAARIVLVKTSSSPRGLLRAGRFVEDWTALSVGAAHYLMERGAAVVGIDYMSVDPAQTRDFPSHRALLGAGVLILENCCLDQVSEGLYDLTCLPVHLAGAEGAPVRAFLRPAAAT
jgi:arylformamidase